MFNYYFPFISFFHFLIFLPSLSFQSPPPTIPAFLEQSDVSSACPLTLSQHLFANINDACSIVNTKTDSAQLHRSRCCPVLAASLYSAYSATALSGAPKKTSDLPLMPDESETCVKNLEKGLRKNGMELVRPNQTCDLVYCYCGIRLHPLSCPESFSVSTKTGKLVGDFSVKKLERNCLSTDANGYVGRGGCSKCLNTLYQLNEYKTNNTSKTEERTNKMHCRDCELMGLTWLLAKNQSAYIHTVSAVLRAIMMSPDGSNPQSCNLNREGMPLAVDSFTINSQSSQLNVKSLLQLSLLYIILFFIHSLINV